MVAYNSRGPVREQFSYAGTALKVEEEFKYLGVIFHKSGGMDSVDGQRARAFMGAAQGVVRLAGDLGMQDRVPVVLQLLQTYAVSHGLYASQVWSTGYLTQANLLTTRVQQMHLSFLRSLVGVRRGTSSRALLNELGHFSFTGGRQQSSFGMIVSAIAIVIFSVTCCALTWVWLGKGARSTGLVRC